MATSKNTRQPTGHIAPFGLRLQPELKSRLEAAAEKAGRSLNAELVARLEHSLSAAHPQEVIIQEMNGNLPMEIAFNISLLAKDNKVPLEEMFARVYAAGIHKDAPEVLYLAIHPGVTAKDLKTALDASRKFVRSDATIISEMHFLKKTGLSV